VAEELLDIADVVFGDAGLVSGMPEDLLDRPGGEMAFSVPFEKLFGRATGVDIGLDLPACLLGEDNAMLQVAGHGE
jgi:hypothetical protein